MCNACQKNPVYQSLINKIKYCKSCFNKYFEKKVRRCIRIYRLVEKSDRIGIAVSGGKDSVTALYLVSKILKKYKPIAFTVDEGISRYKNINLVKKFCKLLKIPLKVYTYRKEFGFTFDQIAKNEKIRPCSLCGVLRRQILNKKAKELKLTKLITGHNLDDEAQTILMNQFKNNIDASSRLGPMTGVIADKRFVRRIKPLYFMLEDEVRLFAKLNNLPFEPKICPHRSTAFRNAVAELLDALEKKHPGTKYAVVNSFLKILPCLKKGYSKVKIQSCKLCKEPCSQNICQACNLLNKIKNQNLLNKIKSKKSSPKNQI